MGDEPRGEQRRYKLTPHLSSDPDPDDVDETQIVHEITTPRAQQVADLLAIRMDLAFVRDTCDFLLNLPTSEPELADLLNRAMWSSSLVAYSRCFNGGIRFGLTRKDVRRVSEEALDFHTAMRWLRDTHVAHSVSPHEFIKIGVMVGRRSRDDDEGITGLSTLFVSEWQPHPGNVDGLGRLAQGLLDVVQQKLDVATPALVDEVDGIGLETVKTWPELSYTSGPIDPGSIRDH